MASCGFRKLLFDHTECGLSSEYDDQECVTLKECNRDVTKHLQLHKISSDPGVNNEMQLLLARAGKALRFVAILSTLFKCKYCLLLGIFSVKETHESITICPRHRDQFGVRWRCGKVYCLLPNEIAWHKSQNVKGDRRITSSQSRYLLDTTLQLIEVGSPICTTCKKKLVEELKQHEFSEQELKTGPDLPEITVEKVDISKQLVSKSILEESEGSSGSLDAISKSLSRLDVNDPLFSPDEGSTASTQSDEAISTPENVRHEMLNRFLLSCGLIPLERRWLKWDETSDRTKQRYVRKTSEIISSVLMTISSENAGFLWQELMSSTLLSEMLGIELLSPIEKSYLESLAESYHNAKGWDTRRQILSIMSGVTSYNNIVIFIPGLTRYRFSAANLHKLEFGTGAEVDRQALTRIKVDLKQLDHFLAFITSPHLVQDLPFGNKKLKLTSGQTIEVPNVIRALIPERIVRQYSQYCSETGFTPFSRSTMLRVLSECSATVRRSLQGLDYYAAEGAQAFDNLTKIVHQLGELIADPVWESTTINALKTLKLYLKGDYKVHVKESSEVPQHCIVFSLSDPTDEDYGKKCNHQHDAICERCELLGSTLNDIKLKATTASFSNNDDRDETVYIVNSATLAIESWQRHILRCVNQDKARIDVMELLDDNTILIINDWAMKFIPQKYRESQADWYGKRGISWHISVVYYRINKEVHWQAFVHAIESCTQDSFAVVPIMEDVLANVKNEFPQINKAYIRQDNAGCYHSAHTILACPSISKSSGIKIVRLDFSDPQGGKGAADRLAATCKAHIRAYVNEGNDVTTVENMKDALQSSGGIQGVRVVALKAINSPTSTESKIVGINKLNNFEFHDDGKITAWRAYGIGEGKDVNVESSQERTHYNWLKSTFTEGTFKSLERKSSSSVSKRAASQQATKQEDNEMVDEKEGQTGAYPCPYDGCVRVFQRLSALEKHMSMEKCQKKLERLSLLDRAKLGYKEYLEEGAGVMPTLSPVLTSVSSSITVSEGWALKASKKSYRFNDEQKKYLDAKFNIGQETGRKMDPNVVSVQMRKALNSNGECLFTVNEFLSPQQIKSYFSRRAAKLRQQCDVTPEDAIAAEEETNFSLAREAACDSLQLQHPVVYNQYNICDMYRDNSLGKLKLGLLQEMCESLELNVPQKRVRRRAPYIDLLKEVINSCSCQNI